MKRKFVISVIAIVAIFYMSAQINNTTADGYCNRALLMYQDENYVGCIDQFSRLKQLNPSPQQREIADYYIAMSAMANGDADAIVLLNRFLCDYSTSLYRMDARMAIGDYYFNSKNYAAALSQYKKVEPLSLSQSRAEDYAYRKAYSYLMLADYLDAVNGFLPLLNSAKYGNSAKFYSGYIAYTNKDYDGALRFFDQVDESSELGDMINYYKSQIYFLDKDFNKAFSLAEKLIEKKIDHLYIAEANRIAGESLYNKGDVVRAIPYLQRYVQLVETPLPSTLYILGVSQYKNREYSKAIETLSGVTGENNAMGQSAYLFIGQALLKQGNNNAAMMALDKAVKKNFDSEIQETAFYNYAVASMQGGTIPFGSSVANFEAFLSRFPQSPYAPKVQEYIVAGYISDKDYEHALNSIEQIKQPSGEILKAKQRVLYMLGVKAYSEGNYKQAISKFNQSKELAIYAPNEVNEADLWLGNCYYALKKYETSAEMYLKYVTASHDDAENLPLAYYNLGYARFNDNRFEDAIINFENALDDSEKLDKPVVADAYCRMADCFYFMSDFNTAIVNYDKAYKFYPLAGDYALYQKAMMKGNIRDLKGKIKILNDVLEQYPSSGIIPSALLEKAECYIEQGNYQQAINTYSRLVKEYSATAQGRNGGLQLAIAYLNIGNNQQAIACYKNVISQHPTSDEARIASQDLMKLYAKDGMLESYTAFMATIPGAIPVERSEIEEAAYLAAEDDYLEKKDVGKFKSYIVKYPGSLYAPSALAVLADYERQNKNDKQALEYADRIISQYPDNAAMETALKVRSDINLDKGKYELAFNDYVLLEKRASSTNTRNLARIGIARTSFNLGKYDIMIRVANELLASQIDEDIKSEVLYCKAVSLSELEKESEAIEIWSLLDDNVENIYGAKSAVKLSQLYYDNGNYNKAREVIEAFINASTPHQYWLARGFILLSDINRKEGKIFEANEYLHTLRENYPGGEADIFKMIDDRLK